MSELMRWGERNGVRGDREILVNRYVMLIYICIWTKKKLTLLLLLLKKCPFQSLLGLFIERIKFLFILFIVALFDGTSLF